MSKLTIRKPSGVQQTFNGREAWALRQLVNAGAHGLTTLEHPAPRWSHYIYKLRRAGLSISTDYEGHKGEFPGTHGRYRLETPLEVVSAEAAQQ
ncbi:hypothetical protein [Bradyrhizobium sp. ORS 111]|uniref:winged helix domain-containing protein n=1 Tax=Bradyrhizobium sp. ORS 111 TaxID=1685958 RepID=UPI003890D05F